MMLSSMTLSATTATPAPHHTTLPLNVTSVLGLAVNVTDSIFNTSDGRVNFTLENQKKTENIAVVVLKLITLVIIFVTSLMGNTMVLVVIFKHLRFKTVTNVFIACLSTNDLLMTLLCQPLTFVTVLQGEWVLGRTMCISNSVLLALFTALTSCLVACITIDRYFVVVRIPRNHKSFAVSTAGFAVCGVACLALLVSFPWYLIGRSPTSPGDAFRDDLVGVNEDMYKPGYPHCMYVLHGTQSPGGLVTCLVYVAACQVLPLVCMLFCLVSLLQIVHNNGRQVRPAATHVSQLRFSGEMRTAKTVIILGAVHFCTRCPYWVMAVIAAVFRIRFTVAMDTIATWLLWLCCALHPLIYALRNPTVGQLFHLSRRAGYQTHTPDMPHTATGNEANTHAQNDGASSPRLRLDFFAYRNVQDKYRTEAGPGPAFWGDGGNGNEALGVPEAGCARGDTRSDSIPSVLFFVNARKMPRKGSNLSNLTTSTHTTAM